MESENIDKKLGAARAYELLGLPEEARAEYDSLPKDHPSYVDFQARIVAMDAFGPGCAGANSKVVHEADLKLSDFPGRESMMQAMGADGSMLNCTVRMYCRGDRIYEVMVSAAAGKISSDDIDSFLNSFQLLPVVP